MKARQHLDTGLLDRASGNTLLTDYDPKWPHRFRRESVRIRAALGQNAVRIEHIGSTAVPGLKAKPVIDVLLVVRASSDEHTYVPALRRAGYVLTVREPRWHEHRMFNRRDASASTCMFSH